MMAKYFFGCDYNGCRSRALFVILSFWIISYHSAISKQQLSKRSSLGDQNVVQCPIPCTCNTKTSKLNLPTVTCTSANLTNVPAGIPRTTKELDLKSNAISELLRADVSNLTELRELTLSRNYFRNIPTEAIRHIPKLEILMMDHNKIQTLRADDFKGLQKLYALNLGYNAIDRIEDNAFSGLQSLHILELNDNKLTEIPLSLKKLPNLAELSIANNKIKQIDTPFHTIIPKVVLLEVRGNPIQWVDPDGFTHLKHLKKLILSDVKNLTNFPHLNGTVSLEILRIDRCNLEDTPNNLCGFTPKLKSLDLKSNRVTKFPDLKGCKELKIIDISSNSIEAIDDGELEILSDLHDLHISRNKLTQITRDTFRGLHSLRTLDMSYNKIDDIHPDAFLPVEKLEDLNLGNNFFAELPSRGLEHIIHLKTFNNPNLKEFPLPESFPKVRTLVLSYAYHCCQFSSSRYSSFGHPNSGVESILQEEVFYPTDKEFDSTLSMLNLTELWPGIGNFSNQDVLTEEFINSFVSLPDQNDETLNDLFSTQYQQRREIQCIPQPGPFLPCNDLFDWWTLRCGVWIVFLLALMGNGTVVFVLIFARTKLDVPRFLVCNLAIADFFMGIYLGFLAVIDAATLGEFRKFAIPWQLSTACQTAGFLGVLSSELSVYTLAVITMERHYAITHAMHLNKRLSLRHATYIMILGWTFSLTMALLPLFGISDYRKFAVCLPFEVGDSLSLGYVVFLMFANGVAFTILMGCYLKMYCSIRGSQAWNSNDTRIAKRMALLVFTDLACWFPIAFFSLTAVFGVQLVTLEQAKVFTVFILPFNSCCNPFLYAILTKQFKKDCVLICKAIEESRVTRGIGRCRNSSNFSNRQTANNTGSLIEKSSRDGQPCICQGINGGDMNGTAKYRFLPRPEHWNSARLGPLGRFISRYVLCQNNSKAANRQARDDYKMRNVRRYLYTSGNTGNFQGDQEKHQRHPSVSSDNFSSSRSDSWRAQGRCGIPLRLLEPRRRNSWAVTRKPSQDSNLSNSRNDSSGTSNSTATWRLSRSSVSSDAASHSGGGKSSLKKIAQTHHGPNISTHHVASVHNPTSTHPLELSTTSPKLPERIYPSCSPNQYDLAEAMKRPKTLQFSEDDNIISIPNVHHHHPHKRNSLTHTVESDRKNSCRQDESVVPHKSHHNKNSSTPEDLIDDDEASAKIATNRPRLVRQSAFFSDEVVIEPEICPVHGSLIPGTYDDEYDDENPNNISDIEEEEMDPSSPILKNYSSSAVPILTEPRVSNNPYGIALVVVPRRLSTISSRDTTSIQSVKETEGFIPGDESTDPITATSSQSQILPSTKRKLSEQPAHLFFFPATSNQTDKRHSMSSIEIMDKTQDENNSSGPEEPVRLIPTPKTSSEHITDIPQNENSNENDTQSNSKT